MQRDLNKIIILTILLLLAIINVIFFLVSQYSGSIIGFFFAIIISIQWWRKKNSIFIIIIAFMWILLHIFELIIYIECSYPVFLYMNLLLPIPLLCCGIIEYILIKRGQRKE
ncbi:MAG: hypothetical protein ACTSRI_00150 [Promethearchaeota archaeon]